MTIYFPLSSVLRGLAFTLLAATAGAGAAEPSAASSAPEKVLYVCPGAPEGAPEYDQPGFCGMLERVDKRKRLSVAVLLFKGAQIIDYAGPMEIFGQAGARVFTVAPSTELRRSVFGLQVRPDYDFEHAPPADVLLVPGGNAQEIAANPAHVAWLRKRVAESKIVLSVCTGAFLLGEAGLLDGLPAATTFAPSIGDLAARYPKLQRTVRDRRFVDTGKIITTAGLSAGIDGALHVVDRWMGREESLAVARGVEYDWKPDRQDSYGMLASNRMPAMWHMMLPPDIAWDRYSENGDAEHWETRAHVVPGQPAEAMLDFVAQRMQDEEHWTLRSVAPLWRSFRREQDGRSWEMHIALEPSSSVERYDFVVTLRGL